MDAIETFEHNGKTIEIWYEPEPEIGNPRDADNLGIMLATGHRRYTLGDEPFAKHIEEWDDAKRALDHLGTSGKVSLFPRWARIYLDAKAVLPLWLIDHSGLAMRTGPFREDPGGWDSGIVGFIFDTPRTREMCGTPDDRIEEGLKAEVECYNSYLQGEVYGYTVTEEDGDEESCGGFLGSIEYVKQSARDAAGYTCKHCNADIARGVGPVVDAPEGAEHGGAYEWTHGLCKVCHQPVAWGKEGCYHVNLDLSLAEHHKADSERRRACPSGDTIAEPAQFVGSYE